jgi:cytochrome c biogenesis protein CcdA
MDILLGDIPALRKTYSFTLKKYDIELMENFRILEQMEQNVAEPREDLPVVFIGDSVFYGPEEVREKLEATLKIITKKALYEQKDTVTAPVDTGVTGAALVHIYYFYQTSCQECDRVDVMLEAVAGYYNNVAVHAYNIFNDTSKVFFEGLAIRNHIPESERLVVPAIIIGDDYLIRQDITLQHVEALIGKYQNGAPAHSVSQFGSAEQTIFERFSRFSILGILIAGFVDGVNPCAFATLIFFVSYLLFIGKRRKEVILMALFFIIAVFITYFAIGLGAYNILTYLTGLEVVAQIVFLVFGVIAIVLGILSLRDYVMAKRGTYDRMILQLPLGIKRHIHTNVKEKTAVGGIIVGSLIAGFLISFLEFGCTGQVYLPTITFMVSRAGFLLKPVISLMLYNVMFVSPLIIIALVATLFSTKSIAASLEKRIPTIKLITALLFFGLGILLITSA